MYENYKGIRRERTILAHNSQSTQHGKDLKKVSDRFLTDAYNMKLLPQMLPRFQTVDEHKRRSYVTVKNSVEVFLRHVIEETGLSREFYEVNIDIDGGLVLITSPFDEEFYVSLKINMLRDLPDSLTIEKINFNI